MTLDEIKALPKGGAKQMDESHDFVIDKVNKMSERMEALSMIGNLVDPDENDTISQIDVVEYTKCFTGEIKRCN